MPFLSLPNSFSVRPSSLKCSQNIITELEPNPIKHVYLICFCCHLQLVKKRRSNPCPTSRLEGGTLPIVHLCTPLAVKCKAFLLRVRGIHRETNKFPRFGDGKESRGSRRADQIGVLCLVSDQIAYKIGNWAAGDGQRDPYQCCLATIFLEIGPDVMGCFGSASSKADQEESKRRKEANKRINQQIQRDKQVYRATHRLLLLGKTLLHQPYLVYIFLKKSFCLLYFCHLRLGSFPLFLKFGLCFWRTPFSHSLSATEGTSHSVSGWLLWAGRGCCKTRTKARFAFHRHPVHFIHLQTVLLVIPS